MTDAKMLGDGPECEQPHRFRARNFVKLAMLYAVILTLTTGLYLLSPKPHGMKIGPAFYRLSPALHGDPDSPYFCGETVQLGARLSFPLNCDSMEFIDDAIVASRLLKAGTSGKRVRSS